LQAGVAAMGNTSDPVAETGLEVAVLDRGRTKRTFRRITNGSLSDLLAD
jgi:hypothetical protein